MPDTSEKRQFLFWHSMCTAVVNLIDMKKIYALVFGLGTCFMSYGQSPTPVDDPVKTMKAIWHHDSLFWQAYNVCDVDKMATFFTDDMEFYHDKGGLTVTKEKFIPSTRSGLCGNPNWRLRREAVAGSVQVFPLKDVGGLISGEHVFYINEKGKKEFLDGYGKFLQVWRYENGQWKMSRILSYDHGSPSEKLKKP
jgi:hypothetical protein